MAESPTIAITQSARATSLRQEAIEKLPNGREFTDVVNQVGGANVETNRYTGNISIDGAETTDLVFGTDAGGKLLFWHGWSDPALSALATIDYYEAVEAADPEVRGDTTDASSFSCQAPDS